MSRIVRRVFVGGALVAALAFVSPAEAAGRSRWAGKAPGFLEQTWQWVAGVLGVAGPESRREKFGGGIDPNGTPGPEAGGTTASSCTECDRGMAIDPNG
ncbi:MAG TPA: hypothetical protein VLQ45_24180 [Thermoanaerobaculia bacterium]|nr:hypothetical protein [Thermoanaerobaculia bacterium]